MKIKIDIVLTHKDVRWLIEQVRPTWVKVITLIVRRESVEQKTPF